MGWLKSFAEGYAGGKLRGMEAVPMTWYSIKGFFKKHWWVLIIVGITAVSIAAIYVQKWMGW